MTDRFDDEVWKPLRAQDEAVQVDETGPSATTEVAARTGSRSRFPVGALLASATLIGLIAIAGVSLRWSGGDYHQAGASASVGTAAPATSANSQQAASLPSGGISASTAEALATSHVPPDAVLVAAVAGPFASVYSPPGSSNVGADGQVKPTDLVWSLTYDEQVVICPPSGSACWSPRPGTVTVVLDYATGEFQFTSTYAPAP